MAGKTDPLRRAADSKLGDDERRQLRASLDFARSNRDPGERLADVFDSLLHVLSLPNPLRRRRGEDRNERPSPWERWRKRWLDESGPPQRRFRVVGIFDGDSGREYGELPDELLLHACWRVASRLEPPTARRAGSPATGSELLRAEIAETRARQRKGAHTWSLIWNTKRPSFWNVADIDEWDSEVRVWLRAVIKREALDLGAHRVAGDQDPLETDRRAATRRERRSVRRWKRLDLEKAEREATRSREGEAAEPEDPLESATPSRLEVMGGAVKRESEPASMLSRHARFRRSSRAVASTTTTRARPRSTVMNGLHVRPRRGSSLVGATP